MAPATQNASVPSARAPSAASYATIGALLLFVAGFLFGLDPGGGARFDLYAYHLPTIYGFHTHSWMVELRDYPSATTPLFHILESLNPFLGHDVAFRASSLVFSLFIYGLYIVALRRRFADAPLVRPWALFLGAALLLSPYFEGTTYWPDTDTLPIFFTIVAFLLLRSMQDGAGTLVERRPLLRIALLAFASLCAFYTRQSYLFLGLYAFVLAWMALPTYRWWTVFTFSVMATPGLFLVYRWRGLTPPSFQVRHQGFSPGVIVYPLTMVAFYALPILAMLLLENRDRWRKIAAISGRTWMILGGGALLFLLLFHGFTLTNGDNGGIASKVFARCGKPGPLLFLLFAYSGVLVLALLLRSGGWKSRLLIVLFFLPTLMMKVVFERYYDPLLYTLFFLYCDRSLVRRLVQARVAVAVLLFMAMLLGGSLLYHRHQEPVFPIYEKNDAWQGTNPTGDSGLAYHR